MKYLVESALLSHGLFSVSNEKVKKLWRCDNAPIVWIDSGEIKTGMIDEFLEFRLSPKNTLRIDCNTIDKAVKEKLSGALTASGTMEICRRSNIPAAITCGMGGIGAIKHERLCPDLPAIADIPCVLVSSGLKDMLDRKASISWLKEHNVKVMTANVDYSSGYLFEDERITCDGIFDPYHTPVKPPLLILNEIPHEIRIKDKTILNAGIKAGVEAEFYGKYFHPACNRKIDELTHGYSSDIQLEALIKNIEMTQVM